VTELRNLDEAAMLDSQRPDPERGGSACGCDTDPVGETEPGGEALPVGCSLDPSQLRERLERWRRLVAGARHRERRGRTFRADFAAEPGLAAELAGLCALETECCPALSFQVELHAAAVTLRVIAPDDTTMERFADLLSA
jgi:hypothetical protein